MNTINWDIILDFAIISSALLLASFLREKIKPLKRILAPINILAGLLCLFAGQEFLAFIDLSPNRLGNYVYHLLPLTFIAMSLRKTESKFNNSTFSTGLILSLGYSTQAFIGLSITFLYILFISPDLFPNFGYLLMLGFGQGPGQAYSLGTVWEQSGFTNGGALGLTFAALGYLWAAIPGVILIAFARKRSEKKGLIVSQKTTSTPKNTSSQSTEINITSQFSWIAFVYLLTFCLITLIEKSFLSSNSAIALQIKSTLWGVHFIIASLLAILVRKLISLSKNDQLISNSSMTKFSGVLLDFMVVSAIAAISINALYQHLGLILFMSTAGGIAMIFLTRWLLKKSQLENKNERFAAVFGTLTGTLSTGLTLNRIIDPEFKTPASQDLVLGAGISVPFTLPIFASFILPLYGRTTTNPHLYYLANIAMIGIYILGLYFLWRFITLRNIRNNSYSYSKNELKDALYQ